MLCVPENIFDCGQTSSVSTNTMPSIEVFAKLISLFADELNLKAVGEKADIGD